MNELRARLKKDVVDAVESCGSPRGSAAFEAAMCAVDRYAQHCAEKARSEMADYCVAQLSGTPTLADGIVTGEV